MNKAERMKYPRMIEINEGQAWQAGCKRVWNLIQTDQQ
jgi:hypothetical protein